MTTNGDSQQGDSMSTAGEPSEPVSKESQLRSLRCYCDDVTWYCVWNGSKQKPVIPYWRRGRCIVFELCKWALFVKKTNFDTVWRCDLDLWPYGSRNKYTDAKVKMNQCARVGDPSLTCCWDNARLTNEHTDTQTAMTVAPPTARRTSCTASAAASA